MSSEQERAEYDLHENNVNDPGYRRFLSRLAGPLLERLPAHACGLDFGCGPGPALVAMLREAGLTVSAYDPFYAPDSAVLARRYDFVCATEVVEHLHHPAKVWESLWQMLEPGGYLGLMTKLVLSQEAFSCWHYINDPTHVVFYSRQTIDWWATRKGVQAQYIGSDVILIRK